ncbi:unnamed protein product [Polarella glacialis]|uniref:Uncharacterized protein n=1 Tax=Polarella glacialis TaxID=89957 RepID=A0A813ING0_POLGL|nr:unnamed protein product [Polarella glacialis]
MARKMPSRMPKVVGIMLILLAAAAVTAAWAAIDGDASNADCVASAVVPESLDAAQHSSASLAEESLQLPGVPGESLSSDPAISVHSPNARPVEGTEGRQQLGVARLAVLFGFAAFIILWIIVTVKWAVEGSLPARLAIWGFLPEAYAAISVRAVVYLLRLKTTETPVVLLRNCVSDAGAKELAEALGQHGKKADLQALELPHNRQLGGEGIRAIVEVVLLEGVPLVEFDLSYNPQLGDAVVVALQPLMERKASKLNTLKLADCGLGLSSLRLLATGACKLRLQTLDLSGNALSGSGELLAELLEAPVLEELALACCGLELADVEAVAEQLPYTSLRTLQLAGNGIDSTGLRALAEHLPKSQIDELGLEGNEIKAEDLSPLGTAWAKRPFSRLRLNGNQMTQAQIASFVRTLRFMQA